MNQCYLHPCDNHCLLFCLIFFCFATRLLFGCESYLGQGMIIFYAQIGLVVPSFVYLRISYLHNNQLFFVNLINYPSLVFLLFIFRNSELLHEHLFCNIFFLKVYFDPSPPCSVSDPYGIRIRPKI